MEACFAVKCPKCTFENPAGVAQCQKCQAPLGSAAAGATRVSGAPDSAFQSLEKGSVGNLVCPAEFNVGEDEKGVVLSITEGDDKPMKYPLIFKESAVTVLNKVDILPYTNFDMASAREDILTLHPAARIIETSCTTGQGMEEWFDWLRDKVKAKKG